MMASDSSLPPPAWLPGETAAALREALRLHAHGGGDDDLLRDALARFSADARERSVPPEEVLVQLKRVWGTIPMRETGTPPDSTRALQRVVTLCIREYFR